MSILCGNSVLLHKMDISNLYLLVKSMSFCRSIYSKYRNSYFLDYSFTNNLNLYMKTNSKVAELLISYSAHIVSEQKISNSRETYSLIINHWNLDTIEMLEEVKILLLNKSNKVLGVYDLSKGGICSSIIDIKIVLSIALKALASGIIIVHNHPSGNLSPSKADVDITEKLKSASNLMDIAVLDHLIISKDNYYSFADDGLL